MTPFLDARLRGHDREFRDFVIPAKSLPPRRRGAGIQVQYPDFLRSYAPMKITHRQGRQALMKQALNTVGKAPFFLYYHVTKLLEEIYDWFTEGFDTRDLKEAKSLLEH